LFGEQQFNGSEARHIRISLRAFSKDVGLMAVKYRNAKLQRLALRECDRRSVTLSAASIDELPFGAARFVTAK